MIAVAAISTVRMSAAISIPGISGTPVDGIDGEFAPATSLVVDLSEARTGAWDSAPAPGTKGVYDPDKWAVVYKYSSVRITTATVTFKNNSSRAPVVWLVTGDVTIGGTIRLDGEAGNIRRMPEPGPGGFRGGLAQSGLDDEGSGYGPGGGARWLGGTINNAASHQTKGGAGSGPVYGDPEVRQLVGGSGGGSRGDGGYSGGAGGGALLIIATGRITINGQIHARGGGGAAGGGSGGAIRLVASEIGGTGTLDVEGGVAQSRGSPGYIRVEAQSFLANTLTPLPSAISSAVLTEPVEIWPESSAATSRIVSVGGLPVSADPLASLGIAPTDVNIPFNGSRQVVIETRNFPTTGSVTLFVIPPSGDRSEIKATLSPGSNESLATWNATLEGALSGRIALQVRAAAE